LETLVHSKKPQTIEMPYYSAGPQLLDIVPSTPYATFLQTTTISNQIQQGQSNISNTTIIPISAISNHIIPGIQTTITNPSIVASNVQEIISHPQQTPTMQISVNGQTEINIIDNGGGSKTDPIYDLILNVFQEMSDPANMEANNYATTVIPLLDKLDAEINKYPDISKIILNIQSTFQRVNSILVELPKYGSTNYITQYVLPQLTNLDKLIEQIPTS